MSDSDLTSKPPQSGISASTTPPGGISGPGLPTPPQFSQQLGFMFGNAPDPFIAKLNDDHISKMIEGDRDTEKHTHHRELIRLVATVFVILIVLAFIVLFCYLFASTSPQLVDKVIFGVLGFIAGLGGGYGLKSAQSVRESP